MPASVYCGSLPVVQGIFSCPLSTGYSIAGNHVTNRILRTSRAGRIAPSRFSLEHPWPYVFRDHRLPSLTARESSNYRQGNSSLEKHPWYANQWQARLQDVPAADHGLVLFMQDVTDPTDQTSLSFVIGFARDTVEISHCRNLA